VQYAVAAAMSLDKPSPPTPEQENPYYPPGPQPLLFEEFKGMDTSVPRIGVSDQQCAWIDGFMPIKKRNLRTLYGKGALLYNSGVPTIVDFGFYNIGAIAYAVVFLSNGAVNQVRVSNGATTAILPSGSILTPSILNVGFTQWNSQYLIIVANQANGYWVWDGSNLFQAGTLGPVVTLTNVGAGYKTTPIVVATGGSGSGATFVATIANGVVTNVIETNPGTGYLPGQTITLVFSGGNSGGSGAALTAVLGSTGGGSGATFTVTMNNYSGNNWNVGSVVVTNGGSGYSQFTTLNLTITSSFTTTITPASLQPVISGGVITGVTIVNAGQYNKGVVGGVTATLSTSDSGAFHVTSVTVNNGGSGYSASTTVIASGGGSPIQQATLQPVIVGGVITSVTVASGGLYGTNTPPTLTVADAPVNASATVALMPFGVQGTAVETYAGHVWVANGPLIVASAPGSVVDFATSDGGVAFTASNSKLKVGYTQLLSTNGFLMLIGDSAVDYISGVTTSGTPPTTTYSYLNADPQTGTPYPASVLTLGNMVLLANSVGVHQLAGSTFTKVSDDLDGSGIPNGLWSSVTNFGGNQLSSSKATIFNRPVWMVLATVLDPISAAQVNKLFMWDGKEWWASQQDMTLIQVASLEINSVLTAYGTDGNNIYPLFQTPSTGFSKVVQSRLWDGPGGYTHVKASTRLWGLAYVYANTSPTFTVNIDNENTVAPFNNNQYVITPAATGYFEIPPEAVGQQGIMTGLTITTSAADMSLVSVALQDEIVGYRG
jgi:hypothetical protein